MKRLRKFGLRTLLIVTALVAIGLSWLLHKQGQARDEKNLLEKVTAVRGSVTYYHNCWDFETQRFRTDPVPGPWVIRKLFGEDIFVRVNSLTLRYIEEGFDFSELGKFTRLNRIDLLSPPDLLGFDDLPPMPTLERFNLTGIPVSDLRNLSGLGGLKYLSLYDCESLESLDGIQSLKKLEDVWLNYNRSLRDIGGVAELENLRELHLDNTRVEDFDALARCKSLTYLSFVRANFPDVNVLSKLTNLETLKLGYRVETIGNPDGFLALTRMKYLEIGSCDLDSVQCLRNMRQLDHLVISNCGGLESLEGLEELRNLKSLYLKGCNVPAEESERIQRCLPGCQVLNQ